MFQPRYLSTRYTHPLDNTIRRTGSSWYVRWFVKSTDSLDHVHSVSTIVQKYAMRKCPVPPRSADTDILHHRKRGLEVHHQIDLYFNLLPSEAPPIFHQWWTHFHSQHPEWSPLRTEMIIRSDVCTRLVGVIDLVLFRIVEKTLELWLVDWKVSTDHEYNVYSGSLQLNLYKHLLEKYYCEFTIDGVKFVDVRVVKMLLVFFAPDLKTVHDRTVSVLRTEVVEIVQDLQNYVEDTTNDTNTQ